jgi:hypothetical protein
MVVFLEKRKKVLYSLIFFVACLFVSYLLITVLPISYTKHRAYSTPSNEGNYDSSTMGGEALLGIEGDNSTIPPVPVFLGPLPGATNVSLNTVIYVFQTRPVENEVELDPKTTFAKIENIHDFNTRNTIYYPTELLEPNTTYNVSGSIMGFSAWWTFTTASMFSQPEYEYNLTPYAWSIALTILIIATIIFIKRI